MSRMPTPPIDLSGRMASLPAGGEIRHRAPATKATDLPELTTAPSGTFEGYASLFGVMDLGRDVVMPGAFRHTLTARGTHGVRLLWQHDPARPIGRWMRLEEDHRGLRVCGRLDLDQPLGREVHGLMRRGLIDGLSIGYRTESERHDPETGLRRIDRIDLWEISLVTFPMLPQARVTAVKAAPGAWPVLPAIRPL